MDGWMQTGHKQNLSIAPVHVIPFKRVLQLILMCFLTRNKFSASQQPSPTGFVITRCAILYVPLSAQTLIVSHQKHSVTANIFFAAEQLLLCLSAAVGGRNFAPASEIER
jgi:hypothetical protein